MQQAYIDRLNEEIRQISASYEMNSGDHKYGLIKIAGACLLVSGAISGGIVYGLKPNRVRVKEDQSDKIDPKNARLDQEQALLVLFAGTVIGTIVLTTVLYYATE